MKAFVILIFLGILVSLGSAVKFLVADRSDSDRLVQALTWRIGLSIVLFLLLIVGYKLGWITPNADTPGRVGGP
jgi:DUF2909 family protein